MSGLTETRAEPRVRRLSKTGVLGYIGSFPIPEVVSGINATMLGAQTINPNIKVKIIWANSWFDPGKEADAAKMAAEMTAHVGDAVRAEVRGLSREFNAYQPTVRMDVPSWLGVAA